MLNSLFQGLFDSDMSTVISIPLFLLCVFCSLIIGFLLAITYMYRSRYSKSFVVTLAVLPAIVCVVIMMVNGNIGTSVAVAGTFSLVRFRSVAGTAREIGSIFLAMAAGLIAGMGYLGYALIFTLLLSMVTILYSYLNFGADKNNYKLLHITIPEDLDYTDVFKEPLTKYTSSWELVQVKTTNMGSLFRLTYALTLQDAALEKEFINELRCRNGNLEITISRQETVASEL